MTTTRPQQAPPAGQATCPPAEFDHDRILQVPVKWLKPSPENEKLYRPVNPNDPEIIALAESIEADGIHEALVVTRDGWIISGHRRHVAAKRAGLAEVPVRFHPIRKDDDHDEFMRLLRECNRQRVKSFDEVIREEVISANPEQAYQSLIEHRTRRAKIDHKTIKLRGKKHRAEISKAKFPMLEAVREIIQAMEAFLPLTDRRIHYCLLNNPPLIHASKPDSRYANDKASYRALVDLLTRARLAGEIPMELIDDETRPMVTWDVCRDVGQFICQEVDGFLLNYWRDLMQSQPNHVEILGEKNTLATVIRPVAAEFCIPMTLGRGYCSLRPRDKIVKRFNASGKDRLVLLILSDFDPDGEEIAHSFARSLRDDFGVAKVDAIKVGLTAEQVKRFRLPPAFKAKAKSTNYRKFVRKFGDDVFELEALPPDKLQAELRKVIDSVIDVKAFNAELEQEKRDAARLSVIRRQALRVLSHWTDEESAE